MKAFKPSHIAIIYSSNKTHFCDDQGILLCSRKKYNNRNDKNYRYPRQLWDNEVSCLNCRRIFNGRNK